MSGPVVAAFAVVGALAGWFVVAELISRIPDRSELSGLARAATSVVTAAAWGVTAAHWSRWWQVLPFAFLAAVLVCVSAIDLRVYRIPNKVVFPSLGVSLVLVAVGSAALSPTLGTWPYLRGALLGAGIYFVLLLVPHLVYPKGMGMGDVKLALVMGLYLGWGRATVDVVATVASALLVGCVLGVVSGLVINLLRRRGGAFPFGPSLAVGCMYALIQAAATI